MFNLKKIDKYAVYDLTLVMAILVVVKQLILPVNLLLAGPASTLVAMVVATRLLSHRGLSWSDIGFRKPRNWIKSILLSVVCFFAIALAATSMSWLTDFFLVSVGDSGRFNHVEGNATAYFLMLLLVWTHGSFFEELLFRAFMISRGSAALGGGLKSDLIAVIFSSIFFGYRHYYYQGIKGAIVTGFIGLVLSILYLWFGRKNILPLILGHGLVNTLSQTQRFLGDTGD